MNKRDIFKHVYMYCIKTVESIHHHYDVCTYTYSFQFNDYIHIGDLMR